MTKSYFKSCDFCKEKIEMSDSDGKWRAYNLNNGPHDCKKKNGSKQDNHSNGNNDITLDVLLKRLASFGISIDLEKLRNEK